MRILNIETATELCSIAIAEDETILATAESENPYEHAAIITKLIDQCVRKANIQLNQLDAIAVSTGPGSYTALRVGTSTAKGICYALQKPLIAISTLESLAHASIAFAQKEKTIIWPMIDARRMEVYTAPFNTQLDQQKAIEAIILDRSIFKEAIEEGYELIFSGNGAKKVNQILEEGKDPFQIVQTRQSARFMVPLAVKAYKNKIFESLIQYSPNYFKRPYITTPKKIL